MMKAGKQEEVIGTQKQQKRNYQKLIRENLSQKRPETRCQN